MPTMTMYTKSSLLVTTVAVTALIAGAVFSSSNITSAYAVTAHKLRFCFEYTTPTSTLPLAVCSQSMGLCREAQDLYASQEGYTITQPCAKTGGFPI
jgi:hypothetical protein